MMKRRIWSEGGGGGEGGGAEEEEEEEERSKKRCVERFTNVLVSIDVFH